MTMGLQDEAKEISVGTSGQAYVVTTDNKLYQWAGNKSWQNVGENVAQIAVGMHGRPYIIDQNGNILW